jgi:hypothetical protein
MTRAHLLKHARYPFHHQAHPFQNFCPICLVGHPLFSCLSIQPRVDNFIGWPIHEDTCGPLSWHNLGRKGAKIIRYPCQLNLTRMDIFLLTKIAMKIIWNLVFNFDRFTLLWMDNHWEFHQSTCLALPAMTY